MDVIVESKQAIATEDGVYDQAREIYRAITARRQSRYLVPGGTGQLPGLLCVMSSAQRPGEFTDQLIAQAKADVQRSGRTFTFVYYKRRWEVRPEKFKNAKWFNVFAGDETRRPRIMNLSETVPDLDQHLVMRVPEDFRKQFEDSLLESLRDIGGVSTQALHPFIPATERIAACFGTSHSVASRPDADFKETKLELMGDRILRPEEPRFVHADLALTGDSAGLAVGHVEKFVEVERDGNQVETMPLVVFDLLLEIRPPRSDEIQFWKIRDVIYALKEMGMNIQWASLDSYQSVDTIQLLRQRGYRADVVSVDTDLRPYNFLKTAIMDGRVRAPEHARAQMELRQLEWDVVHKKIDHPPGRSKDVADCMAGVVFGLTMQVAVWNRHKVRARLPKRLIEQAKKKELMDAAA
jgi:hypothetical protein